MTSKHYWSVPLDDHEAMELREYIIRFPAFEKRVDQKIFLLRQDKIEMTLTDAVLYLGDERIDNDELYVVESIELRGVRFERNIDNPRTNTDDLETQTLAVLRFLPKPSLDNGIVVFIDFEGDLTRGRQYKLSAEESPTY